MTQAQIIFVGDFSGEHCRDLNATRERLEAAGHWKRRRVVVILPAGENMAPIVSIAHCMLAFPVNNPKLYALAQGMDVGDAYSQSIESLLRNPDLCDWEYVLTIEHDNLPPSNGLLRLIELMEANPQYSAIGGLYFTKGEGGVAQIWGDPSDPIPNFRTQLPDPEGGLVECCGVGMGFTLFRLAMFKDERLRKPWFDHSKHGNVAMTQDLYAWDDFRANGYRCAVACDVRVGHLDLDGKFGPKGKIW